MMVTFTICFAAVIIVAIICYADYKKKTWSKSEYEKYIFETRLLMSDIQSDIHMLENWFGNLSKALKDKGEKE